MKVTIFALVLCALTTAGFGADEPSPSPENTPSSMTVEALIASLPNRYEYDEMIKERLAHFDSKEDKKPDLDGKLEAKAKTSYANGKELQARLVVGKPVSDYPGLLALGHITWNGSEHTYMLQVRIFRRHGEDRTYAGFACSLDQSMSIKSVDQILQFN